MVFATCQAQCQPHWLHYLLQRAQAPQTGGTVTLVSGESKVRLFTGQGVTEGRQCQGRVLSPGSRRCLRAKLFYELPTAKKGKDSPKPRGTPEHPKKLPWGAERGNFVLASDSLSERDFNSLGMSDARRFSSPKNRLPHWAFEIRLFTASPHSQYPKRSR